MVNFIYIGQPTAGKNTRDIKLPLNNGSFNIVDNVEPNVTVIETVDDKSIEFMRKGKSFQEQE